MTTTTDYRSGSPIDEQAARTERARRAVAAFRRMQPMLNNYARTFTGNPRIMVEVSATSNGATDGKKIYFRPPIELGDEHKHTKKLCDRRDPDTLVQQCKACELREKILVVIYHEIAHICYGTFTQPTEQHQADLLRRAVEASGTKYADAIAKRIQMFGRHVKNSYLAMAGQVSPFLPIILNAVEDARVNNNLFDARKGTRVMFEADTLQTFSRGVETLDADGTPRYTPWNEREQNLQLIVGLYCAVSEYDYTDWFIPEVVAVLDDDEVQRLAAIARTTKSVEENYGLSFKFLERFRQLGFCRGPEDPEDTDEEPPLPEPEEDEEPDDTDDSAGDDSEPDSDDVQPGEGDAEPEDDSSSDSEGESGDADGGPSDDEEVDQFGDSDEGSANADTPEDSDGSAESDTIEGDTPGTQATEGGAESNDGGEETDASDASENETDDSGEDEGGPASPVARDSDGADSDDSGTDDEGLGDGSDTPESDESDSSEHATDEDADESAEPGAGSDRGTDDGDGPDHGTGEVGDEVFEDGEATEGHSDSDEPQEHLTADPDSKVTTDGDELEGEREAGEDTDEPIDTGADQGMGGIEVEEAEADDEPEQPHAPAMGTADTVNEGLQQFGHHEEKGETEQDEMDSEALQTAIMQGLYFETPSQTIAGVRIHEYNKPILNSDGENTSTAWGGRLYAGSYTRRDLGIDGDFAPEESVIGRQLLKLRVVFADNQRAHQQNHLKSGRVNTRVLGRRAPLQDERLFRRKTVPGKKSYFVAIALDISGSTVGRNLSLIKAAAWAQADLLTRLGIPFAMYGCSGYYDSSYNYRTMFLDMYPVKHEHEAWNASTQERLQNLGPDGGNLDGHNLEFMRKLCDKSNATDNIIMYYSDGKMPATNHDEELEILQRELKYCKQKGYVVAGVGVRTDSPSRHGLPTVQIDHKNDIGKVVDHLQKMLLKK